jgi:hypothetical protein
MRSAVLCLLLAPSALQAKVQVLCDSPNKPESYWVVPAEDADPYSSNPALLRSRIPEIGYSHSMGESANLPEGRYYLFPVCPNVGIWPPGKFVSSTETHTTIRCP